jgi:hypothetical protein
MQYSELLTHLYHIRLLSIIDRYNTSSTEHFKSVAALKKLETEGKLNLEKKELKASLDYIEEMIIDIDKGNVKDDIESILISCGVKYSFDFGSKIIAILKLENTGTSVDDILFGEVYFELKHLHKMLIHPKFIKLKEYIFFDERHKKGIFKNAKSEKEVIYSYITLFKTTFINTLTTQIKLLEVLKKSLEDNLCFVKNELSKALKNKTKEDAKEYIKQLYTNYQNRINQSHYILVSSTLKNEYLNLASLSQIVFSIVKTNSLNTQTFNEQRNKITSYLNDLFFIAYLDNNFLKEVENINLNDEEVLNLIQNRNKLNSIIYPDYIDYFKDVEKHLINEDYFNKKGIWSKGKEDLIGFIIECSTKGYFKIKLDGSYKLEIRNFFEERYLISIQKQFQPNQRVKLKAKSTQFNWIKKAL